MLFEDTVNGFIKVGWWVCFVRLTLEFDMVLNVSFDGFLRQLS
mgnify:CR=1 FL=1